MWTNVITLHRYGHLLNSARSHNQEEEEAAKYPKTKEAHPHLPMFSAGYLINKITEITG